MKILHTSDWHLGKHLEGYSRLEEQKLFIDDINKLVTEQDIDLVIIAGDIYDTSNPPADAERLFYRAVKQLANNGERIVLVIGGNHDHPERLEASSPIALDDGIIILSKPKSVVQPCRCGNHHIIESGEGYIELKIKDETAVIITMPYPSEKRLGETIYSSLEEKEMQKEYSERLGNIFRTLEQKYRDDTINLLVSHLFIQGGEESSSERSVQLGGSYAVNLKDLPEKAQYIALGHLHKPQRIKSKSGVPIIYSGSPLQYSKSEIGYAKCCYILDAKPGEPVEISKIPLKNYKPIEVWKCSGVEEAIKKCEENNERNLWVYLEIETEDYITSEDIKRLKTAKKDIVEIKPIIKGSDKEIIYYDVTERPLNELFREFYYLERNVEPSQELLELFLSIMEEGDTL